MAESATTGPNTLHLRVVSPEGTLVDEAVESVSLPGLEGDFAVLVEHHDTVAQLGHGIGEYTARGKKQFLSILGGVATVHGDQIEVFSPVCELGEHLDEQRAEAARARAEQRLADHREDIDGARARAALGRALLRLDAAKLTRGK
jgi:F-type H+-transporting ATPase subunit epsilon